MAERSQHSLTRIATEQLHMEDRHIYSWLEGLLSSDQQLAVPSPLTKKRALPLTPDQSTTSSTDHKKRRRIGDSPSLRETMSSGSAAWSGLKRSGDAEITPRPKKTRSRQTASNTDDSQASSLSGTSSPVKQLRKLDRMEGGVSTRALDFDGTDLPEDLSKMIGRLRRLSRGRDIINKTTQTDISRAHSHLIGDFDDVAIATDRDSIGWTPRPVDVNRIVASTRECNKRFYDEAAWNLEVHAKVLSLALRHTDSGSLAIFQSPVDFLACPSATITPAYVTPGTPYKKIDFCIAIDPSASSPLPMPSTQAPSTSTSAPVPDPLAAQEIKTSSLCMPGSSINHTDHPALDDRPFAIAIETKKIGEEWAKATLQIGVWASAHWRLLKTLSSSSPPLPSFLPLLIIQGPQWHFIAATQEGSQTIIHTSLLIGSTDSMLGVYQIVAALQLLRHWIWTEYWPALRERIMGGW